MLGTLGNKWTSPPQESDKKSICRLFCFIDIVYVPSGRRSLLWATLQFLFSQDSRLLAQDKDIADLK